MRLKLGTLPIKQGSSSWIPRKPSWSKATQDHVAQYTSDLEQRLLNLNVPLLALSCENPHCPDVGHSEQRDSFMLDILLALVECSYVTLPLAGGGGGGGHGGKGKAASKPGWDSVEPFRRESLYWHGVWVKEKRPNTGWLHDTMTNWKRQFHYAVRRAGVTRSGQYSYLKQL